jgi:hypothetical protein
MSKGFLTIAQNTSEVDYLRLAYLQALNVKSTHPGAKYAVIVDPATAKTLTNRNKKIFDHVLTFDQDNSEHSDWKLGNEYKVFKLSPFKETIKVESDLLFTRNIDHWLTAFRLQPIVLSTGCKTYRQELATYRGYRKFFDDNNLPDIYQGLMYFKYSQIASSFFLTAQRVYRNWEYLKNNVLKNCREREPSTDVLYAVTAQIFGVENCTLPSMDFINFVHLKPGINGWGNTSTSWREIVNYEQEGDMIRVFNLNQYNPVHYYDKSFATEELIEYYEQRIS